jgi:hypothetical protein
MAKLKQLLKKLKITLKNLWLKLTTKLTGKTVWQLDEGHVIEPAFVSNGVQYYRIKDYFNTFSSRGLTALQVYEEWNMRLQKEHLKVFIDRFDEIVNDPKQIKVSELWKIVAMLKERLDFVVPTTELIYKFASVAFFDKNESPYSYDPEYAKEKIKRWKEAGDVNDFFIVMQLKDILPLPTLSEQDLAICLSVVDQVAGHQLTKLQDM